MKNIPLAQRMRPQTLDKFIGQDHLTADKAILSQIVARKKPRSLLFWGPSGVGKTTLAQIIANSLDANFIIQSAVSSGVKEIKTTVEEAKIHQKMGNTATVLFLDEIHRFNKTQQDSLLPYVENGLITLFGATTENPSIEVNSALLSRLQVLQLKSLSLNALITILQNALNDKINGLGGHNLLASTEMLSEIANLGNGDARSCLNILEASVDICLSEKAQELTLKHVQSAQPDKILKLGKHSDLHYNMISALIKSVRNSNVNAGIYWLARLLESGEDPVFIARRMLCLASEDVGMAAPTAINQAVAVYDAVKMLGMPEARLPLTQVVIYLSLAPKSNAVIAAYEKAKDIAIRTANLEVPLTLRNPTNNFHKSLGYGQNYLYVHETGEAMSKNMPCFPDEMEDMIFYKPSKNGFESKF